MPIGFEYTVVGMHVLGSERQPCQQLMTEVGEGLIGAGHLEVAEGWSNGLRCQAAIDKCDWLRDDPLRRRYQNMRVGVPESEGIGAIKDVVGPAIPEVADVEHRIDRAWRLSWLHFARGIGPGVEDGRIRGPTVLLVAAADVGDKATSKGALGGHHVIRLKNNGRITIQRVGELV